MSASAAGFPSLTLPPAATLVAAPARPRPGPSPPARPTRPPLDGDGTAARAGRSPGGTGSGPSVPTAPVHVRSDAEVLALLFAHGRVLGAHLDLAHTVLARTGGVAGLGQASIDELLTLRGLGRVRACALSAALELGRRAAGRRPERGQRLTQARDVFAHMRARLGSAAIEEFWILGLDVRHRLIFEACVARGSLTGVDVHPREVFRPLIRAGAAAVILCHNHPSGDPTPSRQDFDLTARLKEVGALCGIVVLDHVVVAADGHVSLAERGWL